MNDDHEMIPNQPLKGLSGGPEQEFELNRGLAIDTLLKDYPYLLETVPDFSIFRREVVLQDAQGFSISGLAAYQFFFAILRRLAQTASGLGVHANVNVFRGQGLGHGQGLGVTLCFCFSFLNIIWSL